MIRSSSRDAHRPPTARGRHRKRLSAAAFGAIVGVALAAACTSTDSEVDLAKALPTDIPAGTTLVVADQQNSAQQLLAASGAGKDLPYKLEFANFTGGPAVLEAFRAGTADVAPVGDVPPIHANATGERVPIILARANQRSAYALAVSPQAAPTLKTAQQLRGKRIAYAEGTAQQVVVLRALANAGLTPDDATLVPLQLAEFSEALGANAVDVAPLNEPRLTRYLRDYGRDGASVVDPESTGTLHSGLAYYYARGQSLTDPAKAAAIRHFVGVIIDAYNWVNTHPAEWVKAYYVGNQLVTEEDGWRILSSTGTTAFPPLDDALIATQQKTIDVIDDAGQLPRPISAEDLFDRRFAPVVEEAATRSGVDRTSEKVQQ